jgi:hypothetical protein
MGEARWVYRVDEWGDSCEALLSCLRDPWLLRWGGEEGGKERGGLTGWNKNAGSWWSPGPNPRRSYSNLSGRWGIWTSPTGDVVEGEWAHDEPKDGEWKITYSNSDQFVGRCKEGRPNGYGVCKYSNGAVYTGPWDHVSLLVTAAGDKRVPYLVHSQAGKSASHPQPPHPPHMVNRPSKTSPRLPTMPL